MLKKILILLMSMLLISCQLKSTENEKIDIGTIETEVTLEADTKLSETIENDVISEVDANLNETGNIYIYGELHGRKKILDKELELWQKYYHEDGMRHLFLEDPYYKTQLLNIWLKEDNDEILEEIIGSNYDIEAVHNFFRAIKETCPETVFHGVDVSGYKSNSAGFMYRDYLIANNLSGSELFKLSEKAIEDAIHYEKTNDGAFREQRMYENFVREFNQLDEDVMAIFGNAHVSYDQVTMDNLTYTSISKLLSDRYDERVVKTNLSDVLLDGLLEEAISYDEMIISNNTYQVAYYGKNVFTGDEMISYYEYYRVIDAFEDFKEDIQSDKTIYPHNFPMKLDDQEVYVIVAQLKDETTVNYYAITNGVYELGNLIGHQAEIQ